MRSWGKRKYRPPRHARYLVDHVPTLTTIMSEAQSRFRRTGATPSGGGNAYHCILGGSACFMVHPSDTAPPLVALGARVTVAGPRRPRTVPLESFFVLPE